MTIGETLQDGMAKDTPALVLDGNSLDANALVKAARQGGDVAIAPAGLDRSHQRVHGRRDAAGRADMTLPDPAVVETIYARHGFDAEYRYSGNLLEIVVQQPGDQLRRGGTDAQPVGDAHRAHANDAPTSKPGKAIGTATRRNAAAGDAPNDRATISISRSTLRKALAAACTKNGADTTTCANTTAVSVKGTDMPRRSRAGPSKPCRPNVCSSAIPHGVITLASPAPSGLSFRPLMYSAIARFTSSGMPSALGER